MKMNVGKLRPVTAATWIISDHNLYVLMYTHSIQSRITSQWALNEIFFPMVIS